MRGTATAATSRGLDLTLTVSAAASRVSVDLEGGEHLVLSGTKRLLASSEPPVVVFEMARELATDFDSSPEKIAALLGQFGYSFNRESAGMLEKVDISALLGREDLIALPGAARTGKI